MSEMVLEVRELTVALPPDADRAHAVEGVSFSLRRNEILCLVGESGSGKSIAARAIMGLLPVPRVRATGGEILFCEEDLLRASPERMRAIRGSRISMVFQDPMTALNPLKTIGSQIDEAIACHTDMKGAQRTARILERLEAVHLPEPRRIVRS